MLRNQTSVSYKPRRKLDIFNIIAITSLVAIIFGSALTITVSALYKSTPIIPVLMYHHFSEDKSNSITVTKREFEKQMNYLVKKGYTPITQHQLSNFYLKGTKLPEKPILITIDDGYLSNYTIAYPVLKETGMKATIFAVVSQVGDTPGSLPHFNWKEAREMLKSGHVEIGSHTYNLHHKVIGDNTQEAALLNLKAGESKSGFMLRVFNDLYTSKKELDKNLKNDVIAISYPFGQYNDSVVDMSKGVGFLLGYSIEDGINTQYSDPMRLKRINVPGGWSEKEFANAITP